MWQSKMAKLILFIALDRLSDDLHTGNVNLKKESGILNFVRKCQSQSCQQIWFDLSSVEHL